MEDIRLIDANALSRHIVEWIANRAMDTSISSFIEKTILDEVLDCIDSMPTQSVDSNIQWICTKEKMPVQSRCLTDPMQEVLVIDKDKHVDIAYRWNDMWIKNRGVCKVLPDKTITHWALITRPEQAEKQ